MLPDLWHFSRESGMRMVTMDELYEKGPDAIIEEARRVVGDGPTYISFDVDGLDAIYAPGTGTPEIGGFSSYEALRMLRGLRGLNLVGGDVVAEFPDDGVDDAVGDAEHGEVGRGGRHDRDLVGRGGAGRERDPE